MILKNKSIRKKGEEMNPRNRNILIVVIVVVIVAIAAFFGLIINLVKVKRQIKL